MIIRSLLAENILKYRRIELNNLPEKALIAISGANESGKTALVETICLALFGRTFYLQPESLTKAILWGESKGSVELRFTARDGADYCVHRTLDSEARQSARLSNASGDLLVKGPQHVLERIIELIGFDYREFIESIYLAQKGTVTSSHPSAATASAVTGVKRLLRTEEILRQEIVTQGEGVAEQNSRLDDLDGQLERMAFDPQQLESLQSERDATAELASDSATSVSDWEEAIADLRESSGRLHEVGRQVESLCIESPLDEWRSAHRALRDSLDELEQRLPEDVDAPGENANRVLQSSRSCQADLDQRMEAIDTLLELVEGQSAQAEQRLSAADESALPAQLAAAESVAKQAQGSRSLRGFLFWLLLVPAVALLGGWYLLSAQAGSEAAQMLANLLSNNVPGWATELHLQWLLWTGAGAAGLALLLLFAMLAASAKVNLANAEHAELVAQQVAVESLHDRLEGYAQLSVKALVELLSGQPDADLAEQLEAYTSGSGALFLDAEALAEWHTQSRSELDQTIEALEAELASCHEELEAQRKLHDDYQQRGGELEGAIIREQERVRQVEELALVRSDIEDNRAASERQIKVRELAIQLLQGASRQAMEQFNRDLKLFMSRVMPQLTEDRYHYLIIDRQLDVEVFSRDKHDFINWDEISTGTQQQILLALRLALTAAMAEGAAGGRGQCVVLDEPFAFYDAKRIADSLHALPKVSDKLTQIWVISQEYADLEPFDLHIECLRDQTELVVSGT